MVVDNALWRGEVVNPIDKAAQAIHALNHKARHDSRVEEVMLAIRDGILLVRKF
jgi:caffeoyl-CoA O-methyltransferase